MQLRVRVRLEAIRPLLLEFEAASREWEAKRYDDAVRTGPAWLRFKAAEKSFHEASAALVRALVDEFDRQQPAMAEPCERPLADVGLAAAQEQR